MDYNARFYDPALGRFVQADTIVPSPGDPQSLNRYSYVLNSPLVYRDPSGHAADMGGIGGGRRNTPPPPQENPPPPKVTSREMLWGHAVLDFVEFPIGTSGVQKREEWQHTAGKVAHWTGLGLEGVEATSLVLGAHIPFLSDVIGFLDLGVETFGSWAYGETYRGQPHESLPDMTVIGQDALVSGSDFSAALAAKLIGAGAGSSSGPEGILAGYGVGMVIDMGTTGVSLVYDLGRVTHTIPTMGAIGFYKDKQDKMHIAVLDYQRREGENSSHH